MGLKGIGNHWKAQAEDREGRFHSLYITRRPATFSEANSWVHLSPETFMRHFPYVITIWQTEDGRVLVETDGSPGPDQQDLAWWEQESERAREPGLPCGCQIRVRYVRHRQETICTFWNPDTAFHAKLRISGRLKSELVLL